MPTNVVGLHQMHPPGCQCGCGGNWGCDSPEWGQGLMQCWDQINQLKCIIKQIMDEVGGPVRTGPITGVIDGSDAKPGEVGELVSGQAAFSFAGNPNITTVTVSPLVVPPGDWDLFGSVTVAAIVDIISAVITPQPTGMVDSMSAESGSAGTAAYQYAALTLPTARGSFSVPTLIPFSVTVNQSQSTAAQAGTGTLHLRARRVR